MTLVHLELLRGLAALMVVATHMSEHLPFLRESIIRNATNFGIEAVAVFFALSGYVMAYSQHQRPKSRTQFLRNRFKRIYPTYLIALVFAYAVGLITGNLPSQWHDVGLNIVFAGSLQQHFARLPATNLALWSLTYEVGFYMIFSWCIVRGNTSPTRMAIWTACAALGLIALPSSVDQPELNFFLSILAFSCSWLVGYHAFSAKLKALTPISLPLLALIPAASRLPYDSIQSPMKFCVVALLTIPFFKKELYNTDSPKVIHVITLLSLIGLIAVFSRAQPINIILYSLLPVLALIPHYIRDSHIILQRKSIQSMSITLGRSSYSLYVLHTPLIFIATWTDNIIGYACLPLAIVFLVWLVEYQIQPRIANLIFV